VTQLVMPVQNACDALCCACSECQVCAFVLQTHEVMQSKLACYCPCMLLPLSEYTAKVSLLCMA
jgi:hypothetical protein